MIYFSQRKELEDKYREWIKENNIYDCAFNVITFLSEAGLLVETMDAAKFMEELDRMCESHGVTCFGCPLYEFNPKISCESLARKYPRKVIDIVKYWSEEHKE